MLVKELKPCGILSFGGDFKALPMGPLNVLIGSNGVGKSNLIDVIDLLRSAPKDLTKPIRRGGGIREWRWKGLAEDAVLSIEAVLDVSREVPLRYRMGLSELDRQFVVSQESVEDAVHLSGNETDRHYYHFKPGSPLLRVGATWLDIEDIDPQQSILSQRKDPQQYPAITELGRRLGEIKIYRDWTFGRNAPARNPQQTDLRNDYLEEDCGNLGLVLNRIRRDVPAKKQVLNALSLLYAGIDDFDVIIEGGTVQVFLSEGDFSIPATRLSDGTLRYLCLLAILFNPTPPPLVCIEEPELGLHPDLLPTIARLLREASERMQLIVTTHSDILVDALSDAPEAVIVCDKEHGATTMRRLEREKLKIWLEDFSLGNLWRSGELGGVRW